jgi:hypothetical protein
VIAEIIAALLGATAAGHISTLVRIYDRRREAESVLVAIASEVDSVCRLIRANRSRELVEEEMLNLYRGGWAGYGVIVDARNNCFNGFESSVPKIRQLRPQQFTKIVNFYAFCKAAIEISRPYSAEYDEDADNSFIRDNLISLNSILQAILHLGDETVQFPRRSIRAQPEQRP